MNCVRTCMCQVKAKSNENFQIKVESQLALEILNKMHLIKYVNLREYINKCKKKSESLIPVVLK